MLRPLVRWSASRGGQQRLSIFIYHRVLVAPDPLFPGEVDRTQFDAQVGWIARWFTVLPLQEAVKRLRDGSLPRWAAAITFDDGYSDNLHHALPVLQHHGVSATLFVATGFLDGGCMWNDRIIEAVRRTPGKSLQVPTLLPNALPLGGAAQRQSAIGQLIRRLKYMPLDQRNRAAEEVMDAAEVRAPTDLMLTRNELRCWHACGQQVGAHTVNHPILARLDDQAAMREITQGREELRDLLGSPVNLFAYPNGKPGEDYLPTHVEMVRQLGFEAAMSTSWGAATANSPIFELPRFTPWDRTKTSFGFRVLRNLLNS